MMESCCIMDVTVTSPNFVDMEMFDFWVEGYSIPQASKLLASIPQWSEEFCMTDAMFAAHARDHFAQFTLLEAGLRQPDTFLQTYAYHQLPLATRRLLIHKYYSIDESLLRELVGRRLSTRTRRELSDIAERLDLRLRSCKRQFDNLLRIARRIDDLPGRLIDNIQQYFLLPTQLSESYAAVVFITTNRFEVHKKNLSYITFSDLTHCAGRVLSEWTSNTKDARGDAAMCVDLDLQFFHDLKECKLLLEKREYLDRHKLLVTSALHDARAVTIAETLDANFKAISKAIITIACGLTYAKELRDFFQDIVEKLIEPMHALMWPANELQLFMAAYASAVLQLPPAKLAFFKSMWLRFINPFSDCVQCLYHN